MENFQTLSTSDIRRRNKFINYLSPIKPKGNNGKKKYILNLRVINNNLSEFNNFNSNKLFPKNIKILTIEQYDKLQNKSLKKYKSKGIEKEEENLILSKLSEEEKKQGSETINVNKSNPNIFIKSPTINYHSPNQSLKIINNNNDIFNQISKDSLLRQRILFDNSVRKLETLVTKFKTKMPKIRMLSMNSKYLIPVASNSDGDRPKHAFPPIPTDHQDLKLFSFFKYSEKNFPEGRQQFALCKKGNNIILSGGLSSNMKEMDFWVLNLKRMEWKKIRPKNPINNRFGHSTIYGENKIFIYGGRIKEKNTSILVGLETYSFNDNNFNKPYIQNEPPDRRNHIALYIPNYMLIHGGVGNSGILSDCHLLNLQSLKWNDAPIDRSSPNPKIYGHASCLVIPTQFLIHKNFHIFKFPDIELNSNYKIKQIGIYAFGGKTKEDGGLTNDLWILIVGQKPFTWMKANTSGKLPSPRYFHSMNYYEKSNYIIVHGGRNDDLSSTSALDDTYILSLENLMWTRVELCSNVDNFKVISRYGHQSIIFLNQLIIFGGMNNNNYIGSSLFIIDLEYNCLLESKEKLKKNKFTKNENSNNSGVNAKNLKLGIANQINLPPIK